MAGDGDRVGRPRRADVPRGRGSGAASAARPVDVATIAARVEALRGLQFAQRPVPERVSAEQARREGLSDLDRSYPEARRRADEEVLKLLGLIEPDVDLRAISGSVFGEGVAGYYDPRSKRLRLVDGAAPGPLAEIVLAHELNHALEDQHFGLALDETATDDAALARVALIEGTAMLVMQRVRAALHRRRAGAGRGAGLRDVRPAGPAEVRPGPADLPVHRRAAVRRRCSSGPAGRLGDAGRRPPRGACPRAPSRSCTRRSTWPARSRSACGSASGSASGWRRATRRDVGRVADARSSCGGEAPGWGGDRYELWQRGACTAPPCRSEDVLVMRWAWDTPEAAQRVRGAAARARRSRAATAPRWLPAATPSRSCSAPSDARWRGTIASDA